MTDPNDQPALPQRTPADRVGLAVVGGVLVLLTLMLARVAQLQTAPGEKLAAFMTSASVTRPEPGVRGDLLDRRGRILAATRFGQRVFVDPLQFPDPPGDAMAALSEAMNTPVEIIAQRLIPKIEENRLQLAAQRDDDPWTEPDRSLRRYVSIGRVLDDWRIDHVRGLGIKGVHFETRSVREAPTDALVGPLLGRVGADDNGLLGAEFMLEQQLTATPGTLRYVQDSRSRPLWVEPGGYVAPSRGDDVRMSIDLEIQRIGIEELEAGIKSADAVGGRLIVLDPESGEILAMADMVRNVPGLKDYDWKYPIGQEPGGRPRYRTISHPGTTDELRGLKPGEVLIGGSGRNRCVEDAYEPGSTFKPFMWSATTELGLAKPDEVFNTENGSWHTAYGRPVNDVTARSEMTWMQVLINSSNIGMTKATERMSFGQMHDAVVKFGFGSRTRIGLPGESSGLVTPLKRWSKYSQTSVAMGHEIAVTPMQMVRGFSAFARNGDDAGTITLLAITAVQTDSPTSEPAAKRVLPPDIALLTRRAMHGVTDNLDQRMTRRDPASHLRYDAFGKSGTAEIPLGRAPKGKKMPKGSDGYFQGQYNSSFIAGAPFENPRLIVLVVIDDPGPELVAQRKHYGAAVAGPVVRRVLERALSYLGVAPTVPETRPDLAMTAGE